MKKKLNIALMGSGFMGKAHSNAWLLVNKFFDVDYEPVLKVNFGTDEELTREFAEKWGWEEISTNWQEVIARPDIDVIDIVTPTYIHKDMAVAAAKAGKAIFCEKPCAVTYD
ncbi:MAG: Gfo/Idh/MocA family oxidoreductase, partial [Christensenella sp.]